MVLKLRELSQDEGLLAPGHGLCPGCAEAIIVRQVLQAAGPNTVVVNGTGCLEVSTTRYPYTSWRLPWLHSAFENAAATMSGVTAAYRSMTRRGELEHDRPNFIVFAGDGGTYDIGLQSLSGALERGHRFLFVCLNNQAYMNTGIQRSSATPMASWTTTSPEGKLQRRKDLTQIVAAHGVPYVAQASPHLWKDLMRKVRKGLAVDGPAFINVLSPCPRGWRFEAEEAIELGRAAAESCVWPLYEVADGRWTVNYKPRNKLPLARWLETQGRFNRVLEDRELLEVLQAQVDDDWDELLKKCEVAKDEA